jgi:hypothetical protein
LGRVATNSSNSSTVVPSTVIIITGLVVALAAQDVEDELVVVELIVVVVLGIAVVVMGDPLLSNRAARVAKTRTMHVRAGINHQAGKIWSCKLHLQIPDAVTPAETGSPMALIYYCEPLA